jgi:hypothetical protein
MSFNFSSITSGIANAAGGILGGISGKPGGSIVGQIGSILDPSNARLAMTNLLKGGGNKPAQIGETRVGFVNAETGGISLDDDWRVRVSLGNDAGIFYQTNPGIMEPLVKTNGVVFPYTPSVTTSFAANYSNQKTTHSNYPAYFYESSEVQAIQISGDFTVQNQDEGAYLIACIYFFRACTKMFYGAGENAGNPPPVVFLNGYGQDILPNVPCVVTSFQQVMGNDVDYIDIKSYGMSNRVPTACQLQIGLQPIYSRKKIAEFDLNKFAAGDLISGGFL